MSISLNCISNIDNIEGNNYLMIKILYLKDTKIINNVLIKNNYISKEIEFLKKNIMILMQMIFLFGYSYLIKIRITIQKIMLKILLLII